MSSIELDAAKNVKAERDPLTRLEDVQDLLGEIAAEQATSSRTVVVMPAYNAEKTLAKTVADLPRGAVDEIVLVDDCSSDGTVPLARELGLTVVAHEKNTGYGGNQKTCYREALKRGADFVVMVHPDYQYDSRVVRAAVEFLRLDICDVVLGCRVRSRGETMAGGMPAYKYFANRLLTGIENLALGQNLGDFHSGFRAYRREVLETISFDNNSDDFVFDSEFLAQSARCGFRIGEVPVPVRYFEDASSISFRRSVTYGLATLGVLGRYWLDRLRIRKSKLFAAPREIARVLPRESTERPQNCTDDSMATDEPVESAVMS